jgi:16S rRNA (guanine(966)-N(2))-methyltransferase RsmD
MRIIGGEFRSRRLKTLAGLSTRPTSDKLRETLFNVLGDLVPGSFWYDCYAGSGAVGLEALSRGAEHVVFLESNRSAVGVLRQNAQALGVLDRSTVLSQPVANALAVAKRAPDFVFLDPPYDAAVDYERLLAFFGEGRLLKPTATVIAEHARRSPLQSRYGSLTRYRVLEQGDSTLSFFRLAA